MLGSDLSLSVGENASIPWQHEITPTNTSNFAWILPNLNTIFYSPAWAAVSNNIGYIAQNGTIGTAGDGTALANEIESLYSLNVSSGALTLTVTNSAFGEYSSVDANGIAKVNLTEYVATVTVNTENTETSLTTIQALYASWGCFLSVVVVLYVPMFIKYGYLYPKQIASGIKVD